MAAATFPDQIVIADRDMQQGMSADDIAQQPLDPSVASLAHYPTVLKWLDDNLQWTTQLGQAFAAQQPAVMDAVQRMRAKAQSVGNLQSTPQETVVNDGPDIEIEPTSPDVVYVPEYDPDVIYYTPGIYCAFGIGLPVGLWWRHDWDWGHHHVIYWDSRHPRPHDWWHRPPVDRHDLGGARVWRPSDHHAAAVGDRGYARPAAPARHVPAPTTFRSNVIRQSGPTPVNHPSGGTAHAGQQPAWGIAPTAHAVIPPTHAVIPPTRAVVPPEHAVVPPTHAVVPETHAFTPPTRAIVPAASAPEISHRAPGAYGGMFGGSESSPQTQTFSARGAESRGISPPAGGGYHTVSGGNASHGGGAAGWQKK